MQTDKIKVYGNGDGLEEALEETAKFARYVDLDEKQSLRLRLLTEETLSLIHAIADIYYADFWLDRDEKKVCRIHLKANTIMDYEKKKEFIELSTQKRNEASVGVMGKIRDIFENSLYGYDAVSNMQMLYGGTPMVYGNIGTADLTSISSMSNIWSLKLYEENLEEARKNDQAADAAWDEIEKSIVANIADDVLVSISGNSVEMTIEKTF